MALKKPPLSISFERQIPEFIREEYPLFVSFLRAYYEFYEANYTNRNIEDIVDIDNTLNEFLIHFKKEFNFLLSNLDSTSSIADIERLLLRNIKEFYSSKGSPASFEFLLKLVYNKPVSIYYPSSTILRASDGKWYQPFSFYLNVSEGDAMSLVGHNIRLTNSGTTFTTVFVERVIDYGNNNFEVFIKNNNRVLSIGDQLNDISLGVVGTVLPTITKTQILDGGSGFSLGDVLTATNGSNLDAKYKVIGLDSYTQTIVLGNGTQVNVQHTNGTIEKIKVIKFDIGYTADFTETFTSQTGDTATIKFSVGAVNEYPGYYLSNDGFLSDSIYLQDGKYYQQYSYVIRIDEQFEKYKSLVKSYLHPAGMALYGEFSLTNILDLSSYLLPLDVRHKLYLTDKVVIDDQVSKKISMLLEDSVDIQDITFKNAYVEVIDLVTYYNNPDYMVGDSPDTAIWIDKHQ